VHSLDRAILHISEEIITGCPSPIHLSITSPSDLLREIFTVKGAGTIVRKGSRIIRLENDRMKDLDKNRTMQLLEQSFKKPLADATFLNEITLAYLEDNYRGAALLTERPEGLYLSKFSVDTMARGEGIAQEIWESMMHTEKTELKRPIFWRSRKTNSLNHWYSRQSDGRQDYGPWTVFWIGLPIELIPQVIRYTVEKPEDFISR
jgi:acetylglutamate kinase